MKFLLFVCLFIAYAPMANAEFVSCGPGYILVDLPKKIDGIKAKECRKLWCRDLETGKMMGNDERANSGYQTTAGATELCDAQGNCVECWGQRKWCAGEARGDWNPEYGAYTRGGDNTTYQSYQKGSCFAWRLEKPDCEAGMAAVLQDGMWVCVSEANQGDVIRSSTFRRTGTMKRIR